MANIKVSVIVPVYNTEKYLQQCLDSILSQTLQEIEVICVDDGSTDDSPQILKEFERRDSRVRIITKENDGLGAARNTGIDAARGEYIGFVDSDDFIDTNMFLFLYRMATTHNSDIVFSSTRLYFNDTGREADFRDTAFFDTLRQHSPFRAAQFPQIVECIGVWDRIYRKDFLSQNRLYNPIHVIYEDALFSFQTSILAQRISVCPEAIYKYRKNTGVAITDKEVFNDNYKFDFIRNGQSIKKFLRRQESFAIFWPHFIKYFISGALWHQSNFLTYGNFRVFHAEVKNILSFDDLFLILHSKAFPWKSKVYSLLLLLNCPALCYSLFFYKRIKRRN